MYAQFTDKARKAVQHANAVSNELNHEYIGTEHLLLALLRVGPSPGLAIIAKLQVTATELEEMVVKILEKGSEPVAMTRRPYTPRAKKVLEYALVEALALEHSYVGTEHLLLALIREQEGIAAMVLVNAGISYEMAKEFLPRVIAEEQSGGS